MWDLEDWDGIGKVYKSRNRKQANHEGLGGGVLHGNLDITLQYIRSLKCI